MRLFLSNWPVVLLAIAGTALSVRGGEPPAPEAGSGGNWEAVYKAQLDRKVTFEFVDTPLMETTAFLGSLLRLNVIVDRHTVQSFDDGGPAINMKVRNAPLGETLKQLLQQVGLDYDIRDEAFFIFKAGTYSRNAVAAATALTDAEKKKLEKAMADLSSDLYQTREDASKTILGLGTACSPMLEKLAKATSDSETFIRTQKILASFKAKVSYNEPPEVAKALNALGQKVTFEFVDTPAKEAVNFIFAMGKGDFHFNELGAAPINLKVTDMTLGNALRWLARASNARIVVQSGTPTLQRNSEDTNDPSNEPRTAE